MYRRYTVSYYLVKDNETLKFDSESAACKFLGVSKCAVSSCYRRKCKCKGYEVIRGEVTTHNSTKTRFTDFTGIEETGVSEFNGNIICLFKDDGNVIYINYNEVLYVEEESE